MLQLVDINKSYNKKVKVLTDISYTFETGRLYPIVGGNGAGRTTLFECINGDLTIDSGEVHTEEKSHIFLASKQSVLPMYLTGYEYIKFLCDLEGVKTSPEEFIERASISEETADMMICDYSFENKKKLQLAAFLVQKPYVIMFDEPFDYCTDEYIDAFIEVLNSMKEDHIILVSTGLLDIAHKIAKDIVVLNKGELTDVPAETMKMPEIKKAVTDILEEADNGII